MQQLHDRVVIKPKLAKHADEGRKRALSTIPYVFEAEAMWEELNDGFCLMVKNNVSTKPRKRPAHQWFPWNHYFYRVLLMPRNTEWW